MLPIHSTLTSSILGAKKQFTNTAPGRRRFIEIPKLLFDFFLRQVDRYAGASDSALQQIRYLREGVFLKYWTPEQAAQDALRRRTNLHGPTEDLSAFWNFAEDMRAGKPSR